MYAVFRADAEKAGRLDVALKDDLVSRQSISIQDAEALGVQMKGTLVLIEGTEQAVERATELLEEAAERLAGEDAESVRAAFKRQEDDVASGMGTIFG